MIRLLKTLRLMIRLLKLETNNECTFLFVPALLSGWLINNYDFVTCQAGEGEGEDETWSGDDLTDEEVKTPGEKDVMDVTDSPITRSVCHEPAAQEEELAALLLGKNPYDVSDIVPFNEDCDYPFLRGSCRPIIRCKLLYKWGYLCF